MFVLNLAMILISIHAPSRERLLAYLERMVQRYFNPRSLAGATTACLSARIGLFDFNPRSLAGATLVRMACIVLAPLFQSTLPRGSDPALASPPSCCEISIHAPSRERHDAEKAEAARKLISIQAPSRERPPSWHSGVFFCVFQSTLPRGSDPSSCTVSQVDANFNPRSLAGATL